MECNNGMENEWNSECTQLQLSHVTGTVLVELATKCLGLLFHHRSYRNKSSVASIFHNLSGIMVSRSENGASVTCMGSPETSYTVPCMGPCLLPLRKAATKVVRSRSDRGSRYTDHRQYNHYSIYAQTKIEAEIEDQALISCIHIFGHKENSITIASREVILLLSYESPLCRTILTKHPMMNQQQVSSYHAWI